MGHLGRLSIALVAVLVTGCQGAPQTGYPPLPGPTLDIEAVAVSPDIATATRPVFYFRDPKDSDRLLAYDWTGNLRGAVTVSSSEPFGVYPLADGTVLLLDHAHIASGGTSLGRLSRGGVWAGDNQHVCIFLNTLGGPGQPRNRQISANTFEGIDTPGTLFYQSVTGGSRRLLDYGAFGPHGGPAVLACSAKNDRAIIGGSFIGEMSGLTMIQLSNGKVVSQKLGGAHQGAFGTVVSPDGMLMAEGSTGGITIPGGGDAFTVFRVPSNEVLAEITGSGIEAFSADGTRVLTAEDIGNSNAHQRYALVNLATKQSLWAAVISPGTVMTRPGTGDFLVGSRTYEFNPATPNAAGHPYEDVWLVPADGSARLLLKHASPLQ